MINKTAIRSKYPNLKEGITVCSEDNEKLGKISALDDDSFSVEKGFFFPKEFTARYDDIKSFDADDDAITLASSKVELDPWRKEEYVGWGEYDRLNPQETATAETSSGSSSGEMKVPVAEEELEAQKTMRQAGEVRIRKVVHTELRHLTIPVAKEEAIVERTPVSGGREIKAGEAAFKDETVTVPIMEEEVEVHKRPVVKEEISVRKEVRGEEKTISGEVRKEDVEVEKEGTAKRKAG